MIRKMEVASASKRFLDFWLGASLSCGLLFVNKKSSPRLRPLDLVRLALVCVYFHWSTLSLSRLLGGILLEVA
jgi:hypothetical protein